jgi:ubiquinone/menaquinone biosynthesis C-methylase UbiE
MLKINSPKLALFLIERYKSNWDKGNPNIDAVIGTEDFSYKYALMQVKKKTISGIGVEVMDKDIVEIGCGQGGICLFMAMNGANSVIGIDVSDEVLHTAETIKGKFIEKGFVRPNQVRFEKSFAEKLDIPDESIDLVIADNVFEHVTDIELTLKECKRILKKNGILHIPGYPSILSKFGPHLKYGTKIPWLHIFFTEKAICEAVYLRAIKYPELKLFEYYGGLDKQPKTFRDVRPYKDLSYITNKKMKAAISKIGFKIEAFGCSRPLWATLLVKIFPIIKKTNLDDILSKGTFVKLVKY